LAKVRNVGFLVPAAEMLSAARSPLEAATWPAMEAPATVVVVVELILVLVVVEAAVLVVVSPPVEPQPVVTTALKRTIINKKQKLSLNLIIESSLLPINVKILRRLIWDVKAEN